jgi:hypothetical protein
VAGSGAVGSDPGGGDGRDGGALGDGAGKGEDYRVRLRREIELEKLLDERDRSRSKRRRNALAEEREWAQLRRDLEKELARHRPKEDVMHEDNPESPQDRLAAAIASLNRRGAVLAETILDEALAQLDGLIQDSTISPAVAAAARHELPAEVRLMVSISSDCTDADDAAELLDTISASIEEHATFSVEKVLDEIEVRPHRSGGGA